MGSPASFSLYQRLSVCPDWQLVWRPRTQLQVFPIFRIFLLSPSYAMLAHWRHPVTPNVSGKTKRLTGIGVRLLMRSLNCPPLYRSRPTNGLRPRKISTRKKMRGRLYVKNEVGRVPTIYDGRTDGGVAYEFEWPDQSIHGPVV